jgi:hypothetical protein
MFLQRQYPAKTAKGFALSPRVSSPGVRGAAPTPRWLGFGLMVRIRVKARVRVNLVFFFFDLVEVSRSCCDESL